MTTAKAQIGDIEMAYSVTGEGPPLVAIMGLTGSRGHWRGFPERFADAYRVITFDNRGVGETTAPRGPYSAAQMADDTLGLMDHLGIGAAVVFGVSMGGMIAQEVALKAPARISKLVLGCTGFGGAKALPPTPDVIAAFASVGKGAGEAGLRKLIELNFSPRFIAEQAATIDEILRYGLANRMSPTGFQGQMGAVMMHDTAARLGAIQAPTLLLTGDVDNLIPGGNAKLLNELIPHAKLVTLPDVGHMFWIEAADAAERAMREFLAA